MSRDNWDRLVRAVMRNEELIRVAMWSSMDSIDISSSSSSFRHDDDGMVARPESLRYFEARGLQIASVEDSQSSRWTAQTDSAVKVIQTAFRGYLARSALAALKGIVKLQALIRGHNVRRRFNMTMKCMQALLRVQARVLDQRARLSHDGGRRSLPGETNRSTYLKGIRNRRSMSRDESWATDEWRDCPSTLEELDDIVKARNEAESTRENTLSFVFSQQRYFEARGLQIASVEDSQSSRWTTQTDSAAKVIQTALRGYQARSPLAALKGIVKLQALIRGQNVRKQANMAMKCMKAVLRVQVRARAQRARLSLDGGRRSMPGETNRSMYLKT